MAQDHLRYEEFKSKIKTAYGVDNISQDPLYKNIMEKYRRETCLKKYVFVVDETNDFKNYIVEELCNNSHFGSSTEKLIIIDKNN